MKTSNLNNVHDRRTQITNLTTYVKISVAKIL